MLKKITIFATSKLAANITRLIEKEDAFVKSSFKSVKKEVLITPLGIKTSR